MYAYTLFLMHANGDRVLVDKEKAFTLEEGRVTTGRRESGIPHLKCVDGSAGCSEFTPAVVQVEKLAI